MSSGKPLCEICHRNEATVIVGFRAVKKPKVSRWQFTCAEEKATDETESFTIAASFASPYATVDRLAHFQESTRMDWKPFMEMMIRLRAAMVEAGHRAQN